VSPSCFYQALDLRCQFACDERQNSVFETRPDTTTASLRTEIEQGPIEKCRRPQHPTRKVSAISETALQFGSHLCGQLAKERATNLHRDGMHLHWVRDYKHKKVVVEAGASVGRIFADDADRFEANDQMISRLSE